MSMAKFTKLSLSFFARALEMVPSGSVKSPFCPLAHVSSLVNGTLTAYFRTGEELSQTRVLLTTTLTSSTDVTELAEAAVGAACGWGSSEFVQFRHCPYLS
ncbi:hypothetical protein PIB30_030853 [Stylosanthes scabra]|uniref:Secreted protein n=1 Tax=Stylosanthes scabra TaxID=79078 RepID=A0ABU6UDH5_9FABA|nr:hypothetical protein [Stylosanthes scabra]